MRLYRHILSLLAYTFRDNRISVSTIIVQSMACVNIRIRYGLWVVSVCLCITQSHYHHLANLSEGIEHMKCLADIFCRVCE